MAIKIFGILLIVLGIFGLVLPIFPGIALIMIGMILLLRDRYADIRKHLPERFPSAAVPIYAFIAKKILLPYYAVIIEETILKEGDILLDIGTGTGLLAISLANKYPGSHVIGIDLSDEMIMKAEHEKEALADTRLPARNIEFRVMDGNNLAFEDNFADMIISTGALHHWKDPVRVFNEIYRCLKKNSKAVIYDGYGDATKDDISQCVRRSIFLPTATIAGFILKIHGFRKEEYDTLVRNNIKESMFGMNFKMEQKQIMMRIELYKS